MELETHDLDIGKSIKDIRKKTGLTQRLFAIRCGISISALQGYENGKVLPRITTIRKIEGRLKDQLY